MKMQNTEMEFVAFDAQDVIATSTIGGGPMTAMFTVAESLFNYPAGARNGRYAESGTWNWADPYSESLNQILKVNDNQQSDGTTWILIEGVSGYTGNVTINPYVDGALNITGAIEGTTADKTLTSLADIVEWLGGNMQ